MPIPNRPTGQGFHYHVYDYNASQPFTLQAGLGGYPISFYSLTADLAELHVQATGKGITSNIGSIGQAAGGGNEDIWKLQIGNGNIPVLFTGGVHAREWIGVEVVYYVAEYLIHNYPHNVVNPTARQRLIRNLVDEHEIWFIPMVNPAGHVYSTAATNDMHRLWRKNRRVITIPMLGPNVTARGMGGPIVGGEAVYELDYLMVHYADGTLAGPVTALSHSNSQTWEGVDLNRNFPTPNWGKQLGAGRQPGSLAPGDIDYYGPGAGSELETNAIVTNWSATSFKAHIDYHSYGRWVVGNDDSEVQYADAAYAQRRLECLNDVIQPAAGGHGPQRRNSGVWYGTGNNPYYRCGPCSTLLYPAFAALQNYSIHRGTEAAFTAELDPFTPDLNTPNPIGFKLPEADIQRVFEENLRGALAMINCSSNPDPEDELVVKCCTARRVHNGIKSKGCCHELKNWDVYGKGNLLP